ncbi:hypothetical protein CNR22_02480 [Sphingobacteriaceae bacterium]|nr:hypothetical protein CNR22_02480 [Sphingobacteriaceae bacterium]
MHLFTRLLLLFCLFVYSEIVFSQAGADTGAQYRKCYIALPLRFTQLQNATTMLSGIKLGINLHSRFRSALSAYHSFYFKAFKTPTHLQGFTEQPRVFINAVGIESEYDFYQAEKFRWGCQLFTGWGFLVYEGEQHNFNSKQDNYFAADPSLVSSVKLAKNMQIGLASGYRFLVGTSSIRYTSALLDGRIPVHKHFPNGVFFQLSLVGAL